MASITLTSKGEIVIKVGKESYTTNVTVGLDDKDIVSKINNAIGTVVSKLPGDENEEARAEVAELKGQASTLANQLHEMLHKKKEEAPPKEEKKKEEGKETKKEGIEIKKATPTPKVVTIELSPSIIEGTVNDVIKKPDKKIIPKIQKLVDSFESLEEYISKNSPTITATLFNMLYYAKTDFEMYLNSTSAENTDFERILSHMTENKKLSADERELIDIASSAIRGYLLHVAKNNDDFSKEITSLGGMKEKGSMDGKLFLGTLLYLRRARNESAQPLELKLPEKALEERKVKYRL